MVGHDGQTPASVWKAGSFDGGWTGSSRDEEEEEMSRQVEVLRGWNRAVVVREFVVFEWSITTTTDRVGSVGDLAGTRQGNGTWKLRLSCLRG
jgi:hypothetical protein